MFEGEEEMGREDGMGRGFDIRITLFLRLIGVGG